MDLEQSEELDKYIKTLNKEKESLIAKYLEHTGLKPDEVVLVEHRTEGTFRFYPAAKNWKTDIEDLFRNELEALKAENRKLRAVVEAAKYISSLAINKSERDWMTGLDDAIKALEQE